MWSILAKKAEPITLPAFEAALPDSRQWISVYRDDAEIRFQVSTDVAAILARHAATLDGRTFTVKIIVGE